MIASSDLANGLCMRDLRMASSLSGESSDCVVRKVQERCFAMNLNAHSMFAVLHDPRQSAWLNSPIERQQCGI